MLRAMSGPNVLVLATLETKSSEANYLVGRLAAYGAKARLVDISLATGGKVLGGGEKLQALDDVVAAVSIDVAEAVQGNVQAIVGLGGGTGGEIALRILRDLPITFPKVLVTTMPFDPREVVADSSIILVPTLSDICGLNATLREVLEKTAAMSAALCAIRLTVDASADYKSVGITGLGATDAAVAALVKRLSSDGHEATVFHSNGYGGAAFVRFAALGAFHAIVDLTPHEVTRLKIAGAHVPMPERFSAGGNIPRILLPGAVNFVGLGERSSLPTAFLGRPYYQHSSFFTHVKLTPAEMETVAGALVDTLNAAQGARALIVPMGGFSHHDCPGGAIEDSALRGVFLEVAQDKLSAEIRLDVVNAHISAPEVTEAIMGTLDDLKQETLTHV